MKKILLPLCLALIAGFSHATPTIDAFNSTVHLAQENDLSQTFYQKTKLAVEEKLLMEPQYIVVVDRNPQNQKLSLVYFNNGELTFSGFSPVSTGDNRRGHFTTPLGWFEHSVENGSYRAQGTKNENGVRGYGRKGMRVWDMGWQEAQPGWKSTPDVRQIRFQMHATDPDSLQQKLGTVQSQGCVRIHESANKFFDSNGVIDKNFEEAKYWALAKDRTPVENAGKYILVIDTRP